MKMEQSVLKRRHINSRRRVITQKNTYNIQNTAQAWNQETNKLFQWIARFYILKTVLLSIQMFWGCDAVLLVDVSEDFATV